MDLTKRSSYFYDLPPELIAQTPAMPRDSSRLLIYDRKTKKILDKHFYDIVDFLKPDDILVINSTKVLPARLFGIKVSTGAKIEILLHKRIDLKNWEIILKPFKRVDIGTVIKFSDNLSGTITQKFDEGLCNICFDFDGVFEDIIFQIGTMPLPPYIHEKLTEQERYQTVYCKQLGSSAAPTAGLHWTDELLQKAKDKGVKVVEVILHVGLGTFRPVKEDDITKHPMHTEKYILSQQNADILNTAKQNGQRIIAVGTTSVRVLESCADRQGHVNAGSGETNIFIYPPYKFKMVDGLVTNFHLPESTLIMLVSAFCGYEETMKIYKHAVEQKYRFFSFGDANFYF